MRKYDDSWFTRDWGKLCSHTFQINFAKRSKLRSEYRQYEYDYRIAKAYLESRSRNNPSIGDACLRIMEMCKQEMCRIVRILRRFNGEG